VKITICSSASFYKELFPIKEKLEGLGHEVLLPTAAEEMRASGNFRIEDIKTWLANPQDFDKKTAYMKGHLEKIDRGAVVLVVNLKKNGVEGYVGGNGLLEMFYGWIKKKPIYILHPVTQELPLYEEVLGMSPVIIDGDLSKIK